MTGLDRFASAFARADADAVVHREDKNLAVADLPFFAAPAAFNDGADRLLDEIVVDGDLQLHFPQEVHFVFVAAIQFGLPLLPPETLAIEHRQAEHLDFREGGFYLFQFAGLNDSDDQFHGDWQAQ